MLANLSKKQIILFSVALIGMGFVLYTATTSMSITTPSVSPADVDVLTLPEPILKPLTEDKIKAYEELGNKNKNGSYGDYMNSLTTEIITDSVATHQLKNLEKILNGNDKVADKPATSSSYAGSTAPTYTTTVPIKNYTADLEKLEKAVLGTNTEHSVAKDVSVKEKKINILEAYSNKPETESNNTGFITVIGGQQTKYTTGVSNSILKVSIINDCKVASGQRIMLRTLEDFDLSGKIIPKNTHLIGLVTINNRMNVKVSSIEYGGNMYQVNLLGYDTDGIEGIYCPETSAGETAKDISSDAVSLAGTSVGGAIGMGASQVLRTATKIFNRSKDEVSVSVAAGYKFYLHVEK